MILRLVGNGKGASHHVILIGQGDQVLRATERLTKLGWAGVEVLGCISDQPPTSNGTDGLKFLGPLDQANEIIRGTHTEDVVIAMPRESYARVEALVGQLLELPCNLWIAPDYFSILLYGSQVENLGGVPMISLKVPTLSGYERVAKRLLDVAAGGLLTMLGLPIMGLIALAIRLDSPGSAFFRQSRVGENGRVFGMLKFRTMNEDAERHLSEVVVTDSKGDLHYKRGDDPRVTGVGRWLRRTSLDELPQLFNVLRGEMSLVGPRPEMPWLVDQYEPWQRKRFAVPQGMTGWWQVNGRSDKPMHLNTEDDMFYVRNYSILLDLRILVKTVLVVLRGRGAY
jgi:exopolysaccharide biosynthesis polyprenyl glycosylphosphotransferase